MKKMKKCCLDCAAVKAVVSQCLMYKHNSGITALACRGKIREADFFFPHSVSFCHQTPVL